MQENIDSAIEAAVRLIAKANNPVSFSGAGLSAESGIATFRDKSEDALWAKFDPMKLASQEGFSENPDRVIDWYNDRRKTVAKAQPNAAHTSLGEQSGWVHITQNVDNLLENGGAAGRDVIHLHGTLDKDHCNGECGYRETIDMGNPPALRNCPECGISMRPSVIWFGESLPERALMAAADAAQRTDLMLVIGTSAQVMPAARLIDIAREQGAGIVIINTEKSAQVADSDIELTGKAGDLVPRLFER